MPAMEIAGLCLPLKPQKERNLNEVYLNKILVLKMKNYQVIS